MAELSIESIEHAAQLIAQADALVIAAGAGMGVDSGLPDFRGNTGFWKAYPALQAAGISFMEVVSPRTFRSDPRLAWGFYGHRMAMYRHTMPHAGFAMLQRWAKLLPLGGFVFTSNVDGQFQKAGFDALRIEEHHGSIHRLQCMKACGQLPWPADALTPQVDAEACQWLGDLPTCPGCGALARPNLLMFGDGEWQEADYAQQEHRMQRWLSTVRRPVVVEIGAGTTIPSVRHLSERVICDHGGRLVRINTRESVVPAPFDVGLACGALQALSVIDAAVDFF